MKLKGIDGGPHKRWSMWINSIQTEEPYLGLTSTRNALEIGRLGGETHRPVDTGCMAVVSSCREVLG